MTAALSRVTLRDVSDDDLLLFFEHQLDPEATAMAAFSPRDLDAFMAHWARIRRDKTVTAKAVVTDGHVVGNVVSWNHSGEPHVGYWIDKEHWGKGVASAALAAFLDEVAMRPLHARAAKHNVASIRVLEKCGFAIAGEAVDSDVEEVMLVLRSG
jgi:RimJ/RimL family protein N-acetyltransferase